MLRGDHRLAVIGAAAAVCVGAGSIAGVDAVGHIDAFYRAAPGPRYASLPSPSQPVEDTGWATYPVAAAPPLRYANGDFEAPVHYAADLGDAWRDEPPVRVHRASAPLAVEGPLPPPDDAQVDAPRDDPVDDWVDPPVEAAPD